MTDGPYCADCHEVWVPAAGMNCFDCASKRVGDWKNSRKEPKKK